jgi:hypothetical protein
MSPAVCAPSERRRTAAGDRPVVRGCGRSPGRWSSARSTERVIALPIAVPEPSRSSLSAVRAASRSIVGGSTGSADVEKETIPTL